MSKTPDRNPISCALSKSEFCHFFSFLHRVTLWGIEHFVKKNLKLNEEMEMITSRVALGIAAGVCGTLFLGYCIYFDHQRHSDPDFKKKLHEREYTCYAKILIALI